MRKRTPLIIGGGGALILIASQLFDFGIGFRGDDELVVQPTAEPKPSEASLPLSGDQSPDVQDDSPTIELIDVLIVGDQYQVASIVDSGATADKSEDEPLTRSVMSIDEIVAAVSLATGGRSGVRVRIRRTPSAIAIAETFLLDRLGEAGLDEDEIDRRRRLVETSP